MKKIFIILCLIGVTFGGNSGYNYPQPADEGLIDAAAAAAEGDVGQAALSPVQAAPSALPVAPASAPVPVPAEEYRKEFYTYSAPAETLDDVSANLPSLKQKIRVVFIRAPESNGIEDGALELVKQASDDKTSIYVLAKQPDTSKLAQQVQNLKSQSHKPEVHFVKYRTPQDAANAKHAIQSKYNSLPGASRNSNEGTAPVLDYASRATAASSFQYLASQPLPNQEYLPASLRRYRY